LADTFNPYSPEITGRTVTLCDNDMATGATMQASLSLVQLLNPTSIVVAVPVAAEESINGLFPPADRSYAVITPENFVAGGCLLQRLQPSEPGISAPAAASGGIAGSIFAPMPTGSYLLWEVRASCFEEISSIAGRVRA
ncbi:hypothetical protein ACTXJE_09995, partial [Glutamicibacter ardleyensis]